MTEKSVQREGEAPLVKIARLVVAGVVQIAGIITLGLMELVALQQGVDGALFAPIAALLALMVGVNARKVMDALGLPPK